MTNLNQDLFSRTISLLKQHGIHPRRAYSQNFLINPRLIDWHVQFAELSNTDDVVEIGPGLGVLTEAIAETVQHVTCIEIDSRMVKILQDRLKRFDNVNIVHGDVLKIPISVFKGKKIISNTPYKISSPLLFRILNSQYRLGLFTFQEEFARRLAARPGDSKYGRLSVNVSRLARIKLLRHISRRWFYPKPKVDSILLRVEPNPKFESTLSPMLFSNFIRDLFSYKNKIYKNALKFVLKKWKFNKEEIQVLLKDLPNLEIVVRELSPEELEKQAIILFEKLKDLNYLERIGLSSKEVSSP
ncbi:MAG: 16S rRNA (adenine(1518)-N(6)/adenine(1519)-N(6))-dimethyltransferase RsmA [Candidatus Helarchaeota archaeon]